MLYSSKLNITSFWLILSFLLRVEQSYQFTKPLTSKNLIVKDALSSKCDQRSVISVAYSQDDSTEASAITSTCFYKTPEGKWAQRINFADLKVGQQLRGVVFQELLVGKTGPKVFFECGVGRVNSKGQWKIVTGMLRLGARGQKKSVVAKRIAKLRKQPLELFVSKVDVHRGRFEVCMSKQEALQENKNVVKKISASTLKPGQEVVGRVVMLKPYGAMVDVGANRNGLLHIVKVADLYERYIDKEKGLEEAGLKVGSKIRVCVASNANKRLFFDFTQDVKREAGIVLETSDSPKQQIKEQLQNTLTATKTTTMMPVEALPEVAQPFALSADEEAAWAAYVTEGGSSEEDGDEEVEEEEEYDDYDEDRDIEDALGLGRY